MPTKAKGEYSNLIRVRNNQRRSRARRREYVAELERKVQQCNTNGVQPCTPSVVPRDTILRLEEENRKLRELLAIAGVEQTLVDIHLNTGSGAPREAGESCSCPQASPETGPQDLSAAMVPPVDGASMPKSSDEMFADSFLQLPADEFGMLLELPTPSSFESPSINQSFSKPSLPLPCNSPLVSPGVNPLCPAEAFLPTSDQSDGETTLCSVAYELIREHNKRGIDMIDISIRLWNGFVKGDGVGGCKVENEVLSSVLEYIKG